MFLEEKVSWDYLLSLEYFKVSTAKVNYRCNKQVLINNKQVALLFLMLNCGNGHTFLLGASHKVLMCVREKEVA